MIVTSFSVFFIDTNPPLECRGTDEDRLRAQIGPPFIRDQNGGRRWTFLAYSSTIGAGSRARLVGFGKRDVHDACTMAVMTATPRQARQHRRRVRNAHGLESPTSQRVDGFRTSAAGAGEGTDLAAPSALALRRLANLLASYSPHDGAFQLRLPGTSAIRLSRMTTEAAYATLGPALCVAAQGAKVVMLGREVLEYDPAHLLVLAVDLPISSQVTRASRKDPYLGFTPDLDPARVAELAARVYPRGIPKASDNRGLYVGRANDAIVDAVTRLLEQMAQPEDADLLGPLVVDEILIRLLRTPIGRRVAQIGQPKSGVPRVAEAVGWIRAHFARPITVEDMASSVHMSASSFHQRFKAVTSMSPLQYQKVLRLHEARRLMLFQGMDATDACRRVGYLSPSQFSTEYARFFGSAPTKDIARLREEGFAPSDGEQ
jgi:AraC-like DNA-binding protein